MLTQLHIGCFQKKLYQFQEPDWIDATQSVNKQITTEDKVIEGPDRVSAAEEIVNHHLTDEREKKNVEDAKTVYEIKLKVDSGVTADAISETTHYASESTKVNKKNNYRFHLSFFVASHFVMLMFQKLLYQWEDLETINATQMFNI